MRCLQVWIPAAAAETFRSQRVYPSVSCCGMDLFEQSTSARSQIVTCLRRGEHGSERTGGIGRVKLQRVSAATQFE